MTTTLGIAEQLADELYGLHCDIGRLEVENAKLRECLQDLAEHIRKNDGFGLDYGWMLDRIRELGVEVDE